MVQRHPLWSLGDLGHLLFLRSLLSQACRLPLSPPPLPSSPRSLASFPRRLHPLSSGLLPPVFLPSNPLSAEQVLAGQFVFPCNQKPLHRNPEVLVPIQLVSYSSLPHFLQPSPRAFVHLLPLLGMLPWIVTGLFLVFEVTPSRRPSLATCPHSLHSMILSYHLHGVVCPQGLGRYLAWSVLNVDPLHARMNTLSGSVSSRMKWK